MIEKWHKVPSCLPKNIEASNLGHIRNGDTGHIYNEHTRIGGRHYGRGYYSISIYIAGKTQTKYIHKLVAEAWLGPRPIGQVINHKDGNKTNNAISNLEYCTDAENRKHAKEHGLVRKKNTEARKVAQEAYSTGLYSKEQAARIAGISRATADSIDASGAAIIKTTFIDRGAIRREYDPRKKNMPELARRYCVNISTIWRIVVGNIKTPDKFESAD